MSRLALCLGREGGWQGKFPVSGGIDAWAQASKLGRPRSCTLTLEVTQDNGLTHQAGSWLCK